MDVVALAAVAAVGLDAQAVVCPVERAAADDDVGEAVATAEGGEIGEPERLARDLAVPFRDLAALRRAAEPR